ncbi:hypothetical protein DL93DRAFT_2168334 [Clavulina sp. PMI_390]|nr:hypothetical protein DL93DRAFT_2168334 [Clavulina sp. PMI_390]
MSAIHIPGLDGLLIGLIFNGFFTGVINAQVYLYFCNFPRDSNGFKMMVGILWVIQMLYLPISTFGTYYELISCQPNPLMLLDVRWYAQGNSIFKYTNRENVFSSSFLVVDALTPLRNFVALNHNSCAYFLRLSTMVIWERYLHDDTFGDADDNHLGLWIVGYRSYTDQFTVANPDSLGHWSVMVWNSLVVVTDLTISVYLSYLMMRKRSAIRSTNSIMNLVMLYGLTTGMVSTVLAITIVLAYKQAWISGIALFGTCGPPVTICAVLANLHMRSGLRSREARDARIPTSFSIPGLSQLLRSRSQQILPITAAPSSNVPPYGSSHGHVDSQSSVSPTTHPSGGSEVAARGSFVPSVDGPEATKWNAPETEPIIEGEYPMATILVEDTLAIPEYPQA